MALGYDVYVLFIFRFGTQSYERIAAHRWYNSRFENNAPF